MTVTIYHNPRCSKSRQTLDIIRGQGIEPEIVEYLKNTPNHETVRALFEKLELESVLPMVRIKEPEAKEAGISKDSADEDLLQAIVQFPKLLERPIVVTDKGARICRPPELVEEIV